jgi:precorrin-6B methylase 2
LEESGNWKKLTCGDPIDNLSAPGQSKTDEGLAMDVDPYHILEIGSGFRSSKLLLSAVELELFTQLANESFTGQELGAKLGLHPRAIWDFLDGLVALGFLDREGDGEGAHYRNTQATAVYLDKNSPQYIGGILEMWNSRQYGFWADLTEALKTGEKQSEAKNTGEATFDVLYSDPARVEQFMNAMSGLSLVNFHALAEKFDFSTYKTLCDVGGATGQLSLIVAGRHPHLRCTSFDLPVVEPIAKKNIETAGLADRVTTASGSFLTDPLPKADVITMGMILHDWNLERKMHLLTAAYDALPDGGALVVIENIIDDARRENVFGLMVSLNMLVEFGDAFDFTGADFTGWCKKVGFRKVEIMPLAGPASAAIAYK